MEKTERSISTCGIRVAVITIINTGIIILSAREKIIAHDPNMETWVYS